MDKQKQTPAAYVVLGVLKRKMLVLFQIPNEILLHFSNELLVTCSP